MVLHTEEPAQTINGHKLQLEAMTARQQAAPGGVTRTLRHAASLTTLEDVEDVAATTPLRHIPATTAGASFLPFHLKLSHQSDIGMSEKTPLEP